MRFGNDLNDVIRTKRQVGRLTLRVMNRNLMQSYDESYLHVVISIRDTGSSLPALNNIPTRIDVLSIECEDWDDPKLHGKDCEWRKDKYKIFQPEDAEKIWEFLKKYVDMGITTIYVHCEADISRSAAIAAAVALVEEREGDSFYFEKFLPNRLVYRRMIDWFVNSGMKWR